MQHNLPPLARRVLAAMIDVVKPRKGDWDLPLEDEMLYFIDTYVGHFPPLLRFGFPWGLYVLEFTPLIFMRKFSRFSNMTFEDRDKCLQGWINSNQIWRRQLIKGVRGLALVGFYNHPSTWPWMNFDLEGHIKEANANVPPVDNIPIPDEIKV